MSRFLIYDACGHQIGSCDHELGIARIGNVQYRKEGLVALATYDAVRDSPVKGLETSGLTLEDFKVECLERGACTAATRTAGRR